jgi:hypothetical protein
MVVLLHFERFIFNDQSHINQAGTVVKTEISHNFINLCGFCIQAKFTSTISIFQFVTSPTVSPHLPTVISSSPCGTVPNDRLSGLQGFHLISTLAVLVYRSSDRKFSHRLKNDYSQIPEE